MTCLIGHWVSIDVVGLGRDGTDHASAGAREQHPAGNGHGGALEESAAADGKRVRVAAFLVVGVDSVGHAHQFYQGTGLWVSSWSSPTAPERSVCVGSSSPMLRRHLRCCCSPRATASDPAPVLRAVDVVADRCRRRPGRPRASPTPPALPIVPPPTSGPPTGTCDQGWATPKAGHAAFTEPLGIIRRTTGVKGPLVVVDMRHFIGPESPPSDAGVPARGRALVHQALRPGRHRVPGPVPGGVAHVRPRLVGRRALRHRRVRVARLGRVPVRQRAHRDEDATRGFPDGGRAPPYDFVRGGAGLKIPGLPDEVLGCLAGT